MKDGYSNDELGKMKMEMIYKLKFMKYVENYVQWYQYYKTKENTEEQ